MNLSNLDVFRGLCWYEWHRQKSVYAILAVIFISIFLTHAIYDVTFLYVAGLFFGVLCGLNAGMNGIGEEYFLSLPPPRKYHYLSRLAVGLVPLILFLSLWILIVNSGLPYLLHTILGYSNYSSFANRDTSLPFCLLCISTAVTFFSINFTIQVNLSWEQRSAASALLSLLCTFFVLVIAEFLYPLASHRSYTFFLLQLVFGGLLLWVGYVLYRKKEIVFLPASFQLRIQSYLLSIAILTFTLRDMIDSRAISSLAGIGCILVLLTIGIFTIALYNYLNVRRNRADSRSA